MQNFSAAQWVKCGDTGHQIFTTGRQFCRPVRGCYLWVNKWSSYMSALISSATRLVF